MTILEIELMPDDKINKVIDFMIERNKNASTQHELESKRIADQYLIPALKSRFLGNLKDIEVADIKWYIQQAL